LARLRGPEANDTEALAGRCLELEDRLNHVHANARGPMRRGPPLGKPEAESLSAGLLSEQGRHHGFARVAGGHGPGEREQVPPMWVLGEKLLERLAVKRGQSGF